jgi:hypothetical protein
MKRSWIRAALGLGCAAAVLAAVPAAQQPTPEVALRQAMDTETVKGDLRGAIAQYEAIVEKYEATNRPVAAEALFRLARALEKTGDARAEDVLRRIVTDFADQQASTSGGSDRGALLTTEFGGFRPERVEARVRQVLAVDVAADGRSAPDPETGAPTRRRPRIDSDSRGTTPTASRSACERCDRPSRDP